MKMSVMVSLCVVLSLCAAGCATSPSSPGKSSAALEPSLAARFSDIPVPAGFRVLPQNSYSFETYGVRVGVLRYQGRANPDYVVSFYKEQMPMYKWSLLNVIEFGERLLNFEREGETCIITITGKGNSSSVTISLGPKASSAVKKQKDTIIK